MSLLIIAYPQLSPGDLEKIQAFRQKHDFQFELVDPHFTLVFPVNGQSTEQLINETKKQIDGWRSFDFCLRCATINKDAFRDIYHTFLVPDEGFSKLLKLHDQLYADGLFPNRSLDIDFIPHITIGNSQDSQSCLKMVEAWNKVDFAIWGKITHIHLIESRNDSVQTVETFSLSA